MPLISPLCASPVSPFPRRFHERHSHTCSPRLSLSTPLVACAQDAFVREALPSSTQGWIVVGKKVFRNPYPSRSLNDIVDITGGCVALTGFHAALKVTGLGLTLQLDTNVSAFCHPFTPGYHGPEIPDPYAGEAINVVWQAAGFRVSAHHSASTSPYAPASTLQRARYGDHAPASTPQPSGGVS